MFGDARDWLGHLEAICTIVAPEADDPAEAKPRHVNRLAPHAPTLAALVRALDAALKTIDDATTWSDLGSGLWSALETFHLHGTWWSVRPDDAATDDAAGTGPRPSASMSGRSQAAAAWCSTMSSSSVPARACCPRFAAKIRSSPMSRGAYCARSRTTCRCRQSSKASQRRTFAPSRDQRASAWLCCPAEACPAARWASPVDTYPPVVMGLLAALAVVDDPSRELDLWVALKSPLFGCTDVDLLRFRTAGGRWRVVQQSLDADGQPISGPVADALGVLHAVRRTLEALQPAAVIDRLLGRTRIMEALAHARRGAFDADCVRMLCAHAQQFQDEGGVGLPDYLVAVADVQTDSTR